MTFRSIATRASLPLGIALALVASACDNGSSLAGDSAGRGTSTLVVDGRVSAENVVDNASTPTYFQSDFRVRVTKNGVDVPDAVVTIDSEGGPTVLTYDAGNNRYVGSQSGYYRVYTLEVIAGADNVRGVRVRGPDIHTIASPVGSEPVDASAGIPIIWDRSVMADGAHLEASNAGFDVQDTGHYDLPFSAISCDSGAAKEDSIRISRERRVIPDGGTGASAFEVRVTNEHAFLILPNPGC